MSSYYIYRDAKEQSIVGTTATSITPINQNIEAVLVEGTARYRFYYSDDNSVFTVERAGSGNAKIITEIPLKIGNASFASASNTVYLLTGDESLD